MDFFESFRAAHFEPLLYLTPKKEVRVIAPKFRAHDYVYTAFTFKKPVFCIFCTTKRGFFGTKRHFLPCKRLSPIFHPPCPLTPLRLKPFTVLPSVVKQLGAPLKKTL